ncbi:MAG TPA: phosphopantetheine-binding protein [Rhodanobacteraceae bacterium]
MDRTQLLHDLKVLIIEECDQGLAPEDIADDTTLLGSTSELGLDSLDALQIAVAVRQRYGTRIEGSRDVRAALRSVRTLADRIDP